MDSTNSYYILMGVLFIYITILAFRILNLESRLKQLVEDLDLLNKIKDYEKLRKML